MTFQESRLKGVWVITLEPRVDERGSFVRTYCEEEFRAHGLNTHWAQCNHTSTWEGGAIRGMHFQADPHPEIKLVRCVRGSIYDVVVDIRSGSPTFGQWDAFELSALNHRSLYIGAGFAHGFQTLEGDSQVFYQMSEIYFPNLARGVLWNDPDIAIRWPLEPGTISARDHRLPLLSKLTAGPKYSGFEEKVD